MRILELLHLFGIGQLRRVDLDLRRLRARLDNRGENIPLLFGIALNCRDQVRNKIGPSLVVVLDVSPLCLGLLFKSGNGVVASSGERQSSNDGKGEAADGRH